MEKTINHFLGPLDEYARRLVLVWMLGSLEMLKFTHMRFVP
jgi:hypothetical protein